jgi:Zn-dependent protease with chaperone function
MENSGMIPSNPKRTWLFLGTSVLLYLAPDLLLPRAWLGASYYPLLLSGYLGGLVLLGFAYGPAICRAMVLREIDSGPWRSRLDQALASLPGSSQPRPKVLLAEHRVPFILTAGLLPRHCQTFVSSGLAGQLTTTGLRFLFARAYAHATLRQRLVALLPVLCVTVLLPDTPDSLASWLELGALLLVWLLLHWYFELDADRQAAKLMGADAGVGLSEVDMALASPMGRLNLSPPLAWRMRVVGGQGAS